MALSSGTPGAAFDIGFGILGVSSVVLLVFSQMLHEAHGRAMERFGEDPVARLKARAEAVQTAFTEAERVLSDLGQEMGAQQTAYAKAVAEREKQDALLAINLPEFERARMALTADNRSPARKSLVQNLVFFLLGLLLSPLVGEGVRQLFL